MVRARVLNDVHVPGIQHDRMLKGPYVLRKVPENEEFFNVSSVLDQNAEGEVARLTAAKITELCNVYAKKRGGLPLMGCGLGQSSQ
eukprot:3415746-Amphidinium_carterae.1